MCGIFGELAARPDSERRRAWFGLAKQRLHIRGPDGAGEWFGESCAIGHTRLAIIDLDRRASQPMTSASGQSVISFNGEIYNYVEIRKTFGAHPWKSSGDTEVLLELLEHGRERAFRDLIGMFAVALFDKRTGDLWLVRDRLGKKPLYYTTTARGEFRFASDVSALLADEGQPRVTTLDRIAEFLQHGYISDPRTGFDGISTVPPGHWLRASISGNTVITRLERYWELPVGTHTDEREWHEEFRGTLQDSVRIRLRADVPLGAFLSGGVDSSVASLLASQELPQLNTFTINFSESAYSEGPFAEEVARHIGSHHTSTTLAPGGEVSVADIGRVYSDLHGDSSALPTLALCREACKHVKVALSGDGGDELLGGYTRYNHALQTIASLARLPSLPLEVAQRLAGKRLPFWLPGSNRLTRLTTNLAEFYNRDVRLYGTSAWPPILRTAQHPMVDPVAEALIRHRDCEPLLRLMATDVETYLPGDILVKVDRASMACGLEVRAPLLDHRLFELTARADPAWLSTADDPKRPLRKLYAERLPSNVFRRPKMGFGVPLVTWLPKSQLGEIQRRVLCSTSPLASVLLPDQVRRLFLSHRLGLYKQFGRIWNLFVLHGWAETWKPSLRDA